MIEEDRRNKSAKQSQSMPAGKVSGRYDTQNRTGQDQVSIQSSTVSDACTFARRFLTDMGGKDLDKVADEDFQMMGCGPYSVKARVSDYDGVVSLSLFGNWMAFTPEAKSWIASNVRLEGSLD